MLFRIALISLVLGTTTLLYWLADADLTAPSSVVIYGIIATTYLLTIVYAVLLQQGAELGRLGYLQLGVDLVIASLLVHATGGAQSAYTFFYPLAIIGAATVRFRDGAIAVAIAAATLFLAVSLLGWLGVIPSLEGHGLRPSDPTGIELARALGLNFAAILGVAFLAVNLGGQLQRTSASLESQRSAAADLLSLHEDIVRSLSSGLITVDRRGRVLTINRAACDILGVAADVVSAAPIERVLPGLQERLAELGPEGRLNRAELRLPRESGNLVLGISVSPLFDHRDRALGRVIHFQDLTEMKAMEEHVKKAERLAVIGSLAAGVAHEIRNPLASISGSVELLQQAPQADDDSRALMDIVTREIDRLNGLIGELLDYTNPRPLKRAEVDVVSLIRETLRVFEQDRSFSEVETSFDGDREEPLTLEVDPEKTRQVLWNLIRNAAEAAAKGGGHVQVRLEEVEGGVSIEIRDDGPGIAEDHLERVFDPFFTTKERGSGLGLATAHNIVTDHGGRLSVSSQVGAGSSFVVHLPYTGGHEG